MTRRFDFSPFAGLTVGLEDMFNEINNVSTLAETGYPKYNIVKLPKEDDVEKWAIEIAVAGFSRENLSVEFVPGKLTVKGSIEEKERYFVHKGISEKRFSRKFTVDKHIEVVDTVLENGILKIFLEKKVPEEYRPKLIEIK